MSKINVYSSSASNAIKVFDASSTGLKPDNAILVTTGTEPSNAIQINVGDKKWSSIAVNFGGSEPGPTPPGPTWETVTIGDNVWMAENLKYDDGGEGILVSSMNFNDVDFGEQYYYNEIAIQRISADFPGWHIPLQNDFELLQNEVNSDCESLRTSAGWSDGKNGTDLKGFHAEPLADCAYSSFNRIGKVAKFIFNILGSKYNPYRIEFDYDNKMYVSGNIGDNVYYTIRLVKDHE